MTATERDTLRMAITDVKLGVIQDVDDDEFLNRLAALLAAAERVVR